MYIIPFQKVSAMIFDDYRLKRIVGFFDDGPKSADALSEFCRNLGADRCMGSDVITQLCGKKEVKVRVIRARYRDYLYLVRWSVPAQGAKGEPKAKA